MRIEQINRSKRMKEQFGDNKFMLKHKSMKWTAKEDDDWGKKHGVKEHSAEDNAVDKIHDIKDKKYKKGAKQKVIRRRGFKK
jgi:hypothetical protein